MYVLRALRHRQGRRSKELANWGTFPAQIVFQGVLKEDFLIIPYFFRHESGNFYDIQIVAIEKISSVNEKMNMFLSQKFSLRTSIKDNQFQDSIRRTSAFRVYRRIFWLMYKGCWLNLEFSALNRRYKPEIKSQKLNICYN